MSVNKRIIPVILVFAIVIFSVIPVQAAGDLVPVSDDSGSGGNVTYVSPVVLNLNEILFRTGDKVEGMSRWLRSKIQEDYCPEAENYRHSFKIQHTQVGGETGDYYICEYCGKSAGEVAQEVYNDYVDDLPAQGITSEGGLIWTPTVNDLDLTQDNILTPTFDGVGVTFVLSPSVRSGADSSLARNNEIFSSFSYDWNADNHSLVLLGDYYYSNNANRPARMSLDLYISLPVSGSYVYVSNSAGFYGRSVYADGSSSTVDSRPFVGFSPSFSGTLGSSVRIQRGDCFAGDTSHDYFEAHSYSGVFYLPTYRILPLTPVDIQSGDTYNINTRAGTLVGDYGIMGDNGQITKVDSNTSIVNETDNSVYNPVTNTTTNYDSYEYDYTTRAYTFTKNDGDTVTTSTVTYGDEYMTIEEGDTVYNVYYVYQNEDQPSPSPAPAPAAHSHSYTGTITKEPTCTIPGQKTMTCSCGDAYVQSVPALGHDWVVKTTVPTVYDEETGELVTDGYTIYQCTRCGEEYRDDDGTGPPGLVDTTASPAAGSWQEFRQRLLDFLSAVPDMFGDLSEFMRESWSYIPSEAAWFLSFGVAMVVVLALWKFWWR